MIQIKDLQGKTMLSVPFNTGSLHRKKLMTEDYLLLKFNLDTPVLFEKGCYAEYGGNRYEVVDFVYPNYNTSTGGYEYELRLDAYYWKWKNKILLYDRQPGNSGEASWHLTHTPKEHLAIICSNLEKLGYTYNGTLFDSSIDEASVGTSAKLVSYNNTNIIDALTLIAQTWDAEWWVENSIIYLGRCEYHQAVTFELDKNVKSMSRSESNDNFATRIYAFGSTRNLPANYRGNEGAVVNGVVQKRLMLPAGTRYIDAYDDMAQEQAVESVVVFEDVYPRKEGTMSEVHPFEKTEPVKQEDGTTTQESYTVYRFKDTGITFKKEFIIAGEELHIVFTSGPLNGMDFGVAFNPENKNESDPEAQLWEIIPNEDYGRTLPGDSLIPGNGNNYILYGFDTSFVPGNMLPKAEQELMQRARQYVEKSKEDPSVYDCQMNMVDMITNEIDMLVGDRVLLLNPAYFDKNGRQSRIYGFEKHLDGSLVSYTVGNTSKYSRLAQVENEIKEIVYQGNAYSGSGSGGVYVIGRYDNTKASDRNVFSALRSVKEFVSKLYDDVVQGLITFAKGIKVGKYKPDFLGTGTYLGPDGFIEASDLVLRNSLQVPELRFNRIDVISGETWNTFAFGKVKSVDTEKRIVIVDLVEGELLSAHVNDIFRGIFHNLTGGNNQNEDTDECGFQKMKGFSTSYFTPTEILADGTGFRYALKPGTTVHPCAEMKFAAYGNFTDKSRQSSAFSTRTTEILLANVNTWTIDPDRHYMYIKGKLDGITIGGMELKGYSTLQRNSYLMGVQIQFTPEQINEIRGSDAYSVTLSTYDGVVVVDGNGHVVDDYQGEWNVITGDENVVTEDENIIASRYKLTTRIQAFRGTQELRYNTVMEEDCYLVQIEANGLEYEIINGVIIVTRITEAHNAYIDMEVNCEGEALFRKHYQITAVLDGSSVWATYHDDDTEPNPPTGDGTNGGWHRNFTKNSVWMSNKNSRLITEGIWGAPVRIAGIDGNSAFALNLTSDTDAIACDSNGKPLNTGVLASTKAVLYIGGVSITTGVGFSMYGSDCTIKENSNNTGVVEVTGISSDNAYVEITALFQGKTISVRYTLVSIKGTAVHQLLPSADVIKRSIEGSQDIFSPSVLNCTVTKADGSAFTHLSTLPAGYHIKCGSTDATLSTYTMGANVNPANYPNGIIFALYNENGTLIDKETIPVVSNGDPVFYLDLTNENASVTCNKDGVVLGYIPPSQAYVYVGPSLDTTWTFSAVFTGCTGTISTSGLIKVNNLTADNATVTVTATKTGKNLLTAVYTLSKTYPGEDGTSPTVYWLVPSVNAVKRNSDGTLTPPTVSCARMKQVGSEPVMETNEKTLKYCLSNGDERNYTGAVEIDSASWLEFILYDGNTVLDRERIPVLSDGSDGNDGNDGGQYVQLYKYEVGKPATLPQNSIYPTDSQNEGLNLTNGWTFRIPAQPVMSFDLKSLDEDRLWRVANGIYTSPADMGNNDHQRIKISFTTVEDNQTVHLNAIVSSGTNSYGYILNPDIDTSPSSDNTAYYKYGSENKTLTIKIPKAGDHFIIAGYLKQGNTSGSDWFRIQPLFPSKLWITRGFCLKSDNMYEAQLQDGRRWSDPVIYSEISVGCNLVSSVSQISVNSVGSITPANFTVYAKDNAGNKTSRYYLTVWKSTNGTTWVRDSTINNASEIKVTASVSFIIYKVRATIGYPSEYTDDPNDYVSEVQINLVKDGSSGSMPRNRGQWSDSPEEAYIWNESFRDIVYILESPASSVWMVNVFGKAVTSRPADGNPEWTQGNKEMFTAIDTALIDGANIANFMFKDGIMQSQEQTNGTPNLILNGKTGELRAKNAYIEGTIDAVKGNIGGFNIGERRLGIDIGTDDDLSSTSQQGMFLYNNMIGFNGYNKQAIIGTYSNLGLSMLGQFSNTQPENLSPNYGISINVRNGGMGKNEALIFGGGYVSGFAVKPQIVSSSVTIDRTINAVLCINKSEITITLPKCYAHDNGKMVWIKNMSGSMVKIKPGDYFQPIHYDSGSIATTASYDDLKSIGDASLYMFIWKLRREDYPDDGMWVQFKNPREW